MIRKAIIGLLILALVGIGILLVWPNQNITRILSPLVDQKEAAKPLEKYYFENLRKQSAGWRTGSEIKLEKMIKEEEKYTSWLFSFTSDGKKVTGMANIPKTSDQRPVIILLRGYADDKIYFTGLGTRKAAGFFAENGFITLAPDFLGFGGSDPASADILEARFERPITVLNLISSINSINSASPNQLFLWSHSNGGQIALSVLEISQRPIPTTLWAPVTKGFPESVLTYIGEMDDQGLKVKTAINQFTKIYDTSQVSVDKYLADISAPLQIHQGLQDPLIKEEWTDSFVKTMKELGKEIIYYKYPRSDHNLAQDWETVVARDLKFFRTQQR